MTGSQTDPVTVSAHVTASAVLLRLASPFFPLAYDLNNPERPLHHGIYSALRGCAVKLLERNALELQATELEVLGHALSFCPPGPDRDFIESLHFLEKVA